MVQCSHGRARKGARQGTVPTTGLQEQISEIFEGRYRTRPTRRVPQVASDRLTSRLGEHQSYWFPAWCTFRPKCISRATTRRHIGGFARHGPWPVGAPRAEPCFRLACEDVATHQGDAPLRLPIRSGTRRGRDVPLASVSWHVQLGAATGCLRACVQNRWRSPP